MKGISTQIIKTIGGYSNIVILPKQWLIYNRLQKGDEVEIIMDNKLLTIEPKYSKDVDEQPVIQTDNTPIQTEVKLVEELKKVCDGCGRSETELHKIGYMNVCLECELIAKGYIPAKSETLPR